MCDQSIGINSTSTKTVVSMLTKTQPGKTTVHAIFWRSESKENKLFTEILTSIFLWKKSTQGTETHIDYTFSRDFFNINF